MFVIRFAIKTLTFFQFNVRYNVNVIKQKKNYEKKQKKNQV